MTTVKRINKKIMSIFIDSQVTILQTLPNIWISEMGEVIFITSMIYDIDFVKKKDGTMNYLHEGCN